MSKKQQVSLNIEELKVYIKHMVYTNVELQKKGITPITINVEGEAGIGKTTAIKQLAEELNYDFVKLNLAQLDELGDLIGYPTRQFEMAKEKEDGNWITLWADEVLLDDYKSKGYSPTGKDKMAYSLPEWVPTSDKGTLILLDDFSRAQQRFIQATMELISCQEYISWKLPANCTILLSSNPDNGDYQVQTLDSAQSTRFVSANLKFDKDVWGKWAEASGIDGRCINFLLLHPELVTQTTNARAITTFFNSISSIKTFEDELPLISMIGEGSVGQEFSNMFVAFINNKLDKLVSPEVMLNEKDDDKVRTLLKLAIGMDAKYRADIASVLATRFANYTSLYSKENPITDKHLERVTMLCVEKIFGNDLQYFVIREILNNNKQKFQKLMGNSELVKMATK